MAAVGRSRTRPSDRERPVSPSTERRSGRPGRPARSRRLGRSSSSRFASRHSLAWRRPYPSRTSGPGPPSTDSGGSTRRRTRTGAALSRRRRPARPSPCSRSSAGTSSTVRKMPLFARTSSSPDRTTRSLARSRRGDRPARSLRLSRSSTKASDTHGAVSTPPVGARSCSTKGSRTSRASHPCLVPPAERGHSRRTKTSAVSATPQLRHPRHVMRWSASEAARNGRPSAPAVARAPSRPRSRRFVGVRATRPGHGWHSAISSRTFRPESTLLGRWAATERRERSRAAALRLPSQQEPLSPSQQYSLFAALLFGRR